MSLEVYEGHKTYRVRGVGVAAVVVVALTALCYLIYPGLAWAIVTTSDDMDDAIAVENLIPTFSIVAAVAQLAALVLTIIWLWRARKNLDAFPDTQPVLSAGWAIGGWFLPIANAFVPGRIMVNVTRQSSRERWLGTVAVGWWIALLLTNIIDQVAGAVFDNQPWDGQIDTLIDQYRTLAIGETVAAVAAVVAATAFALVVPRVSAAQEERIHRGWYEAQNQALGTPPPPVEPSPTFGG